MTVKEQLEFNVFAGRGNPILQRSRACERFRHALSERTGMRVELVLTRNRVSMASVHFVTEGHARVRLHEAFVSAPDDVLSALVAYLRTRRRKPWSQVCAYARTIRIAAPVRAAVCHTRGRVYDLQALADAVNDTYFGGTLHYRVGWGRRGGSEGRRRSIRYGSCNVETRLIRIHPVLDDAGIPEDFVRYILYHEMLHLVEPPVMRNGRRIDHPEAFRRLERQFPQYRAHKEMAKLLLRQR